jgi:hypothetical protein
LKPKTPVRVVKPPKKVNTNVGGGGIPIKLDPNNP